VSSERKNVKRGKFKRKGRKRKDKIWRKSRINHSSLPETV
jgi:hypothetical protein